MVPTLRNTVNHLMPPKVQLVGGAKQSSPIPGPTSTFWKFLTYTHPSGSDRRKEREEWELLRPGRKRCGDYRRVDPNRAEASVTPKKSYGPCDPSAIPRTATTGDLPPPGAPFAGVGRATPGPPASGPPVPPPQTGVVSVGRPPTPGDPGHPPPGRRLCRAYAEA